MSREDNVQFWRGFVKDSIALNPVDRISEIIYGLIMCLTFTGAISASGRSEVRDLLWAALGCNVAWGIVDGIMYVMNVLIERGHARKLLVNLKDSKNPTESMNVLKEGLPPLVTKLLKTEEILHLGEKIRNIDIPPKHTLLSLSDFVPAIQIFFIVFISTIPVALPFLFMDEVMLALRVSNGITLVLLFLSGFRLAHYAGFRPAVTGLVYMLVGAILVSLTIALGG